MRLGTYIHEMLEQIYGYLIAEHDGRFRKVPENIVKAICIPLPNEDDLELRFQAGRVVMDYFNYYSPTVDEHLHFLAVEEKLVVPLTTPRGHDIKFVMYIDLIYRSEMTGDLWIMDHKSGAMWSHEETQWQGQQSVYLALLRRLGRPVSGAVVNNISSKVPGRVPKALHERFQRLNIRKTEQESEAFLKNTLDYIDQIIELEPVMELDKRCLYCPFNEICHIKLNGGNWRANLASFPEKEDSHAARERDRAEFIARLRGRREQLRAIPPPQFTTDFEIVDDEGPASVSPVRTLW